MKLIKEFIENDKISQNFLVNNVTRGITAKGSGYLNIVLQDASGIIEAKKWEIEEYDGIEWIAEKHRTWHYQRK